MTYKPPEDVDFEVNPTIVAEASRPLKHMRRLEAAGCVNANLWASAFLSEKPESHHTVALWFSAALATAFICGQRSAAFSQLQSRPERSNESG